MKATRTLANGACLFGIGTLMLLVLPNAAQAATCSLVIPPADGRILGPYTLFDLSDDIGLAFGVEDGRSYSVEASSAGGTANPPTIFINSNSLCPTTDIASGVTIRNTTLISPALGFGAGGTRRSLVVTSVPLGSLAMRVHNLGPTTSYVVSVTETTLFSPGWSTMGVSTFWSFFNTTNATINGTLTLLNATGTQIAAAGVAILPNRAVFPSTITMAVAAGQAGTARFTHDGPPGAILAEAAITNFAGFFQRVRFEPRRR